MTTRARLKTSLFALIAIALAVAVFTFGFGTAHVKRAEAKSTNPLHELLPDDVVLGKADAPVTIVEYSSMSCPHCASFHNTLLPELKKKYIDTGVVKFTNRHFPLNEPALRAGMVTLCVPKEKAATFTDVLFKMQDKWAFDDKFTEHLKQISRVGGFSDEDFDACMANKAIEEKLLQTRKDAAEKLNLNSTPTFFVNGAELKGNLSMEMFDAAIAKAKGE